MPWSQKEKLTNNEWLAKWDKLRLQLGSRFYIVLWDPCCSPPNVWSQFPHPLFGSVFTMCCRVQLNFLEQRLCSNSLISTFIVDVITSSGHLNLYESQAETLQSKGAMKWYKLFNVNRVPLASIFWCEYVKQYVALLLPILLSLTSIISDRSYLQWYVAYGRHL